MAASALWVNGRLQDAGLAGRLSQARTRWLGGTWAPVLIGVAAVPDRGEEGAADALASFVGAQSQLSEAVLRVAIRPGAG